MKLLRLPKLAHVASIYLDPPKAALGGVHHGPQVLVPENAAAHVDLLTTKLEGPGKRLRCLGSRVSPPQFPAASRWLVEGGQLFGQ